MWKLDGKTLKNKAGLWTSDANWNLPIEGEAGNIEKTSTNLVLGVDATGPTVSVIKQSLKSCVFWGNMNDSV